MVQPLSADSRIDADGDERLDKRPPSGPKGQPRASKRVDDDEIQRLLAGTSRTFALTIPLLEPPLRRQVGLAYLLFRVADSMEDATGAPAQVRIALLEQLAAAVDTPSTTLPPHWKSHAATLWPTDDAPLLELLGRTDDLLATLDTYPAPVGRIIRQSLRETIAGMIWFLRASIDSEFAIRISNISDLRRYCFFVAGIVGEMLTDLFVEQHPVPGAVHAELRKHGRDFGEALQLTNILKDGDDDARDHRQFIPPQIDRAEVFQLAYDAAASAHHYLAILHQERFPEPILRFCGCPLVLAEETLAVVRESGPGAKIKRETVQKIFDMIQGREAP